MNIDIFKLLVKRLENSLELTEDLYKSMNEENLRLKIDSFPSNSISNQAWCIIGARESYFNAIKNVNSMGFSCSLKDHTNKLEIIQKLNGLSGGISKYLQTNSLSLDQIKFVFELLEHEVQHHGQLIRYFYANKLKFPKN